MADEENKPAPAPAPDPKPVVNLDNEVQKSQKPHQKK